MRILSYGSCNFDNNEIFDNKKLTARVTARKGIERKRIEVEFETTRKEVDWVDVKINKKTKRIDVTLRVDLKDGGAEGIDKYNDVSPQSIAYYKYQPLNYQATPYSDIESYTLDGIAKFWSRNSNNIGGGVAIGSDLYEVFVQAKVDKEGLASPKIIYQTNIEDGRSRNWELSRKLFFYEGYLYYPDWKSQGASKLIFQNQGWYYKLADIDDFKMTAAHEIGHEVLLTYGGHIYSKTHKGTSHWSMIIQNPSSNATLKPSTGEIDLMKYYLDYYDIPRTIITEFDLLKLLWLTKLKIK
ncbi:hypothetical protein [Flavobacterium oreochromis]|uniref:Uncharacterized protein n=1 Tax=Flavobacterium columnare TaxID=996 RepID=A0A246G7F2_9FLAO|nr:hypothetical protein [Flavobacterium oreochromis]OWP74404.1 hypothetical protein BWK62_14425 [Flavobacterium oreochromis]